MSRLSRIISSLSRVIPCLPHSFLPLPVLIIHSFALSLSHRVLLSFTLFLPSVYSISHHDMTTSSQFEFTNGKTDRPFGFEICIHLCCVTCTDADMLSSNEVRCNNSKGIFGPLHPLYLLPTRCRMILEVCHFSPSLSWSAVGLVHLGGQLPLNYVRFLHATAPAPSLPRFHGSAAI